MEQQNQSSLFSELSVDLTARQTIRSLASWSIVIVVLAVIGYLIMIGDMFTTPKLDPAFDQYRSRNVATTSSSYIVWTILMIIVGLVINFFLFRFATLAKAGVDGYDQAKLSNSFVNLKAYFMAMAIIMIVIFVLLLLAVTYVSIVGAANR